MTIAAIALGGIALLWAGLKVTRFAFRMAGPISTAMTVLGAVIWVREQMQQRDEERV